MHPREKGKTWKWQCWVRESIRPTKRRGKLAVSSQVFSKILFLSQHSIGFGMYIIYTWSKGEAVSAYIRGRRISDTSVYTCELLCVCKYGCVRKYRKWHGYISNSGSCQPPRAHYNVEFCSMPGYCRQVNARKFDAEGKEARKQREPWE